MYFITMLFLALAYSIIIVDIAFTLKTLTKGRYVHWFSPKYHAIKYVYSKINSLVFPYLYNINAAYRSSLCYQATHIY